ncbi:MAG: hypothetical protein LBG80_09390, partial [Bacteroidales bacterium]|nr:hypothetical protein [Bacteroidales bacterium]
MEKINMKGSSFMKKKVSVIFLLVSVLPSAFCQTASDYFPAKEGYRWEYLGNNGKVTDVYSCTAIERLSDKESLVGIFINSFGVTTKMIYRVIQDTGVFEIGTVDNLHYDNPFVSLALQELKWSEEDRGDKFLCQSKKTSVSFDGKTYNDCIVVEKAIYINNNQPLMIKRQYFARGIGLVYVTLQDEDGIEKPHLRLSSYK